MNRFLKYIIGGFLALLTGALLFVIVKWGVPFVRDIFTSIGESSVNEKIFEGEDGVIKQVDLDSNDPFEVVSGDDVSALVDNVFPCVVAVKSVKTVETSTIFGVVTEDYVSGGSGFLAAQSRTKIYIVTNDHLVNSAYKIDVCFNDGTEAKATLVGTDTGFDLGVLSVDLSDLSDETIDFLRIASFGNSESIAPGSLSVAIGNAMGQGQSVTVGYVSALDRQINIDGISTIPLIQTCAAINPGSSGGPLLDARGRVIGVNCAKSVSTEVESVGYAIPINSAVPIINELIAAADIDEDEIGYLAIEGRDVSESYSKAFHIPKGVYVLSVEAGSRTEESGLMRGDIITAINSREVKSFDFLFDRILHMRSGDTVKLTVMRKDKSEYTEIELDVKLDRHLK